MYKMLHYLVVVFIAFSQQENPFVLNDFNIPNSKSHFSLSYEYNNLKNYEFLFDIRSATNYEARFSTTSLKYSSNGFHMDISYLEKRLGGIDYSSSYYANEISNEMILSSLGYTFSVFPFGNISLSTNIPINVSGYTAFSKLSLSKSFKKISYTAGIAFQPYLGPSVRINHYFFSLGVKMNDSVSLFSEIITSSNFNSRKVLLHGVHYKLNEKFSFSVFLHQLKSGSYYDPIKRNKFGAKISYEF